ncbi:unnamed protein product [Oikopleura dioica]|uniref:Ubiquinone biosynthesis O-methyltransferase, mitochondrial n=1 Tax=Oikopleura dioica TaxID=34765 RepID=E4Y401_OIKDI|nr:unnamed protein product [Oikopleura dioica]
MLRWSRSLARSAEVTGRNCKRAAGTLNHKEVEKFGAMNGDWWDQNGQNSPLHSLNKLRVGYVRDLLSKTSPNSPAGLPLFSKTILDVGCGGGILAEGLAQLGADVTAVDASEDLISVAEERRKRKGIENLTYLDVLVEDLQEIDTRFDLVISSEVLEHVEEPWAFVAYCSNLVKQDGDLIFTTINRTIQSRILAIELAERIAGLLPRGTHDWEKFVTVEELIMDLREVKFRVEDIKGMSWNPFTNEWSWSNSLDVNYLVHAKDDKAFMS